MHFICMASERVEEGLRGAPAQMNFPTLLVSSGIYPHTHTTTTTFFHSSSLIFSHPLNSFNISFTASCFSQIPPSSKSAVAFEDKCDQNRSRGCKKKKKKPGRRAFWVFALVFSSAWSRRGRLTSAVFGDSFDVWWGAAAAPAHSPSQGDCHVDTTGAYTYTRSSQLWIDNR